MYSENPNTAALVSFRTKNGVTTNIKYEKWMNPYETHTEAGCSEPPAIKNTALNMIKKIKYNIIQSPFVFFIFYHFLPQNKIRFPAISFLLRRILLA